MRAIVAGLLCLATVGAADAQELAKATMSEQASAGKSGHTEAVEIVFWRNIDPLAANAQFCDTGSQSTSRITFTGSRASASRPTF